MLSISKLTKRYGRSPVLEGVDLALSPGERVALLGHNGAGKSTLMKLVLGLTRASAGRIEVAGHAPGSAVARALTAYLPENVAFHPSLSAREQIAHYLRLRGKNPRDAAPLLERVGLGDAMDRRIGTYSKGMRQRVGLAQALIGRPRLMVLDEPTSGLDPVSRREFYALLEELAASGSAILLSSHALSEVETKTDRIVILSRGRKVAEGTLDALRTEAALPLTVHLRPREGQGPALAAAFPEAQRRADLLTLTCPPAEKMALMARLSRANGALADFDLLPPSLDDIYAQISGRAA
ncbi:ABC transporter ATP-binding protein [Oceanibium sediminis]|uniref:ABC transporter ATP-binding protein n=1 Tax=Oceanibium sediminis TaxID=2026339 RepID=UPI000DD43C54|nr:ABC transporter ATP-binding protein [Oceanibium sediminis]